MSTVVYTSDWRSRTKAQLLDDIQIVIEQRDKALAKREAAKAVLADREVELLAIKGPCSNGDCRLHYAHSGPCDVLRLRDAESGS